MRLFIRFIAPLLIFRPAAFASSEATQRCLLQAKTSPSRVEDHLGLLSNESSPAIDQAAALFDATKAATEAAKAAKDAAKAARAAVRAVKMAAGQKQSKEKRDEPLDKWVPNPSLQAPLEGGPFSEFFNKRTQGHGIHKWLQYFPAYQRHLSKFIGKEVHIVEIGIQSGGSLEMWKSVFGPDTYVYGCDIDTRCKIYEDDHTKIFIGDQEQPEFWENLRSQVPRIDILIDDGGHTPEQQIATLGIMLEHLSPEGIYITEDIHGVKNPFWQRLQLEQLESPRGKKYTGLGSLVASAHVYPYLLVLERSGNRGGEAMQRQMLVDKEPADTRVALAGQASQAISSGSLEHLQAVFPWLKWQNETNAKETNLRQLMAGMKQPGWLLVRDGDAEFSFDTPWDAESDKLLHRAITDFQNLHEGVLGDWNANQMQQSIDSLHIYPRLLVVKSTDGKERLIKAPKHGTMWIPYDANHVGDKL